MSEALERVIAEQQANIDQMRAIIASQQKDLNTVFTRHEELFHAFVVLIDADVPDKSDHAKWKAYHEMRWAARLKMVEAGFCVRCYNFVCECEVNDD